MALSCAPWSYVAGTRCRRTNDGHSLSSHTHFSELILPRMCCNVDVPPSALFLILQVTAGGEEPEEGEVPNYVSNKGKGPARWAWLSPV